MLIVQVANLHLSWLGRVERRAAVCLNRRRQNSRQCHRSPTRERRNPGPHFCSVLCYHALCRPWHRCYSEHCLKAKGCVGYQQLCVARGGRSQDRAILPSLSHSSNNICRNCKIFTMILHTPTRVASLASSDVFLDAGCNAPVPDAQMLKSASRFSAQSFVVSCLIAWQRSRVLWHDLAAS